MEDISEDRVGVEPLTNPQITSTTEEGVVYPTIERTLLSYNNILAQGSSMTELRQEKIIERNNEEARSTNESNSKTQDQSRMNKNQPLTLLTFELCYRGYRNYFVESQTRTDGENSRETDW